MIAVTAKQFRRMREQMEHSQAKIAKWFGVTEQSVHRWENEKTEIPGAAKVLMWLLYDETINKNKHAVRDYVRKTI